MAEALDVDPVPSSLRVCARCLGPCAQTIHCETLDDTLRNTRYSGIHKYASAQTIEAIRTAHTIHKEKRETRCTKFRKCSFKTQAWPNMLKWKASSNMLQPPSPLSTVDITSILRTSGQMLPPYPTTSSAYAKYSRSSD